MDMRTKPYVVNDFCTSTDCCGFLVTAGQGLVANLTHSINTPQTSSDASPESSVSCTIAPIECVRLEAHGNEDAPLTRSEGLNFENPRSVIRSLWI